jgi:hypothetical protein
MARTEIPPFEEEDFDDVNEVGLPLLQAVSRDYPSREQSRSIGELDPPLPSGTNALQDPFGRVSVQGIEGTQGTSSVDFEDVTGFSCKGATASVSARESDRLQDPAELHAYIVNYLSVVPPEIYIRVRGTHRDSSQPKGPVVDCDFVVRMRGLFAPGYDHEGRTCAVAGDHVQTHRGGMIARSSMLNRRSTGATGGKDLLEWCEDYCSYESFRKQFRVTRTVEGLDFGAIKAGVTLLLRPEYLGKVEVGFTVVDEHIDICPPKLIGQVNTEQKRMQLMSNIIVIPTIILGGGCLAVLICIGFLALIIYWFGGEDKRDIGLFFLRCLGLYVGVVGAVVVVYFSLHAVTAAFLGTKKWNIYTVNWKIATASSEVIPGQSSTKRYAGLSEAQWMEKNAAFLRRLVEGKFEGDATSFIDAPLTRP